VSEPASRFGGGDPDAPCRPLPSATARPARWEAFHHAWATTIAQQLNQETLPPGYYAEPEISVGPTLEIDVAKMELTTTEAESSAGRVGTATWSPPRPRFTPRVDFAHLDTYEIRVFEDLGGAELRAAIELVSPANKDREGSRRTFAAKCAGYLQHGINVVIVDVVTARSANLHRELAEVLEIKGRSAAWESKTGLYAAANRAVTVRKRPRVEISPEALSLGRELPTMPLWLALDLCVPVGLEASYTASCRSLRIPA
jgi:Protein of unknown function (DUF4058)